MVAANLPTCPLHEHKEQPQRSSTLCRPYARKQALITSIPVWKARVVGHISPAEQRDEAVKYRPDGRGTKGERTIKRRLENGMKRGSGYGGHVVAVQCALLGQRQSLGGGHRHQEARSS